MNEFIISWGLNPAMVYLTAALLALHAVVNLVSWQWRRRHPGWKPRHWDR